MKKVVECRVGASFTGRGYFYAGKLECGHKFRKSCRWNRVRYVPGPPVRMKCRECGEK